MKFCPHCGTQLADDAEFCTNCGSQTPVQDAPVNNYSPAGSYTPVKTNGMCIGGFICSFFLPIVGFILSIMGKKKAAENNEGGRGLAIAGIVISIVSWVLNIIIVASGFFIS